MGAGAGAAAAIENEPSPRRAAIEKAQAELRREVAVREERRKELEFLEKGGELLDFFSAANFAFPPSSPNDPLADQLLSSEGEGGFASIALANGDSLENSVGTSGCIGRGSDGGVEHHIDDDGGNAPTETLVSHWEGKGRTLRTGSTSLRSQIDANLIRESESSGSRIGSKGQAYSRRNRPRSARFGNGHTPAREVDKAVEGASTPTTLSDSKGAPALPLVPGEVNKGNETMVDKTAQVLPSHSVLPINAGTQIAPGSAKVSEDLGSSIPPLRKLAEHSSDKHMPAAEATVDLGKVPESSEAAADISVTSSRNTDLKDHVCTEIVVKEDQIVGGDLKLDNPSSSAQFEKHVEAREGDAVSQLSEQVLGNNKAAPDKGYTQSNMVKDECAALPVRDTTTICSHLGSYTSNSECKDKSTPVADSKGDKVMDRPTGISSKHASDSKLASAIDDKTSAPSNTPPLLQATSTNFESLGNKNTNNRKILTASIGGLDLTKIGQKAPDEWTFQRAPVEVKIEEGLSEMGTTRLSTVDTQVESGLDVKSICVVSLPQDEIKTESQSTPVSTGSIRTGFRTPGSITTLTNKFPGVQLPWEKERDPNVRAEAERHKADLSAKARKAHEDYILEEAEIIKGGKKDTAEWAKRRPEAEPTRRKSHWDFVLEEMAWMANDFMQERLWKMASATQFCRWIAQQRGHSDFQAVELKQRQKKVALMLANAVNEFWRSVESILYKDKAEAFLVVNSRGQEISSTIKEESEAVPMDVDIPSAAEGSGRQLNKQQQLATKKPLPVQAYAIRFLRESMGSDLAAQAEAPSTPERISEASSLLEPFWEENFCEEPLFYTVPDGAFEAYRCSMELQRASMEAEHDQTLRDHASALADAESQAVADAAATLEFHVSSSVDDQSLACQSSPSRVLKADEADLQKQSLPNTLSNIAKKKRKNILKSNAPRVEGLPSGIAYRTSGLSGHDSSGGLPSPLVTGKRSLPAGPGHTSSNVGSIPTKRMRSAASARQRVLGAASPSSFPSPGGLLNRATFSSGALSSHQEEVRSLGDEPVSTETEVDTGGAGVKNGLGAGSNNSFVNSKSKKKKKSKHFNGGLSSATKADGALSVTTGSSVKPAESEHRSIYDQLKRKVDQVHASSTELGTGFLADTPETPSSQGQQPSKKAKLSKQTSDLIPEAPVSTAATQGGSLVANTSGTSKLLRQNSNRDRNRKNKSSKVLISQPAGIGIPWSINEDQAILALVHDLGPNWELVSDVLSSSSQLKGIFRKPKQCKERHKALMDRLSVGDGGDSPEDPSTSQPHPSTLPGIPKGSARVLLQRLQGPAEEDTLKVHLEHIVRVVQKFRALKPQNEDPKLLVPVHASHLNVIPQFGTSGLGGGFPTPLELCELSAANPELGGPGYQLPGPNAPGVLSAGSGIRPASNGLPVVPGASNLHMGVPAVAPSTTAVNAARDVHRLAAMRPFSPEEAQRVRYHRAIVAARSLPVPGPTASATLPMLGMSSPNDCPVPMLSPGNSVAMIGGLSRGMSLSRPGLPGMGSPVVPGIGTPALNNMLPPPGGPGMVSAGPTVGPTAAPGQVNLMRRSRDQMVRPGRINEEQRQIFIQELHHQAAQGNTQAATALSTLGSDLSNPLMTASTQTFSSQQQQQQHPNQQQQQQYIARMAKERQQLQHKQRLLPQQLPQPTSLQPQLQTQLQQPQQLHSMSQHVMPQQSHLSQQQHLLPQQPHALQKLQTQQGPQLPVPLPSPPLQSAATHSIQPNHQQPLQALAQSQQQPQPLGQVSQLGMQSKLQTPKQSHKLQHLQQTSQALQQQPLPSRGSKGVVRGSMMMQGIPQPVQSNMLPGNGPIASQLSQQLPGQRSLQSQGPMSVGKQLSQGSMPGLTGQSGSMQSPPSQAVVGAIPQGPLGQQLKGLQQPQLGALSSKQQQLSPPPLQQPTSSAAVTTQPQQSSPPAQQSQSSSSQQRRQSQQQAQMQQSGQRRLHQRQPGPSVGPSMTGQLGKSSASQQGQVPAQMSPQSGHVTYSQGTSIGGSLGMVGISTGASAMSTSGSSSSSGVHSTQWKPGQSVPPMSTGIYNLTRSGSVGTSQLSSIGSSAGMHVASSNGSSGMSVSSAGPHGIIGGLPQPMQVGSGVHGQKMGASAGSNSRGMTSTQQGGAQRPSQQHHGNLVMSPTMGTTQARPPVPSASCGMMPVPALGGSMVGGVQPAGSIAYQGNVVPLSGHSPAISNSMLMFGVQPRQSNAGTKASTSSAMQTKSGPPTADSTGTSGISASSPTPVTPPSTGASSTVSDPIPPS